MRKSEGIILRFEDSTVAARVRRYINEAEVRLRDPHANVGTRLANVEAVWNTAEPPLPHVTEEDLRAAMELLYIGWRENDVDAEATADTKRELSYWPDPSDHSGIHYYFACPDEVSGRPITYYASMICLPSTVEIHATAAKRVTSVSEVARAGLTKSHDVARMLIVHATVADGTNRRPTVDVHPDRPGVFAHGVTAPLAHVVRSQFVCSSAKAHMEGANVNRATIDSAANLIRTYAGIYTESFRQPGASASANPGPTRSAVTFSYEDDDVQAEPWMVYAVAAGARSFVLHRGQDDYRSSVAEAIAQAKVAHIDCERACDAEIKHIAENPMTRMPIMSPHFSAMMFNILERKRQLNSM